MLLLTIHFSVYRPIQHAQMQGNLSLHKCGETRYFILQMLSLTPALANYFVVQTIRLMIKIFNGSLKQC